MTRTIKLALAIAIAAIAIGLIAVRAPDGQGAADHTNPELVAQGEGLYQQHCASCHGQELEGEPNWRIRRPSGALPAPPHDDSGHTWHHTDQQLFDMTKYGVTPFAPEGWVSDMPAFKGILSDQEIWAVLAYIKSQWSERARAFQQQRNTAAK